MADDAEQIFQNTITELRNLLAQLRNLKSALGARKRATRGMLEHMRNARAQNPVLDGYLNRDENRARQWGNVEREIQGLDEENARLAEENGQRLEAIRQRATELDRQLAELQDLDHDGIPDPTERRDQQVDDRERAEDLEDAAEAREEQVDDREVAEDLEDAADDRAGQRDREAQTEAQKKLDERRRDQEQDGPDVDTTAAAAGTATVVADELDDERDERADDVNGPAAEEIREQEGPDGTDPEQAGQLDGPAAEGVREREGLDRTDPEQVRQQQGPDTPGPEQVQQQGGLDGPDAEQGATVGDDGVSTPAGEQESQQTVVQGQDYQQGQNVNGATFVVRGQDSQETQQDGPGQDEPERGERPRTALDRQLDEARRMRDEARQGSQENGQGGVNIQGGVNGVEINGQLPDGEYTPREGGGFNYQGIAPDGQQVNMSVGEGTTFAQTGDGQNRDSDPDLDQLRAHQTGIPAPGTKRPEHVAATADGPPPGGKTPGAQHAQTVGKGGGRGAESGGREPNGR